MSFRFRRTLIPLALGAKAILALCACSGPAALAAPVATSSVASGQSSIAPGAPGVPGPSVSAPGPAVGATASVGAGSSIAVQPATSAAKAPAPPLGTPPAQPTSEATEPGAPGAPGTAPLPTPAPRLEVPPPPQDPIQRVRWLNQRIDEVLSLSRLGKGKVGVAVMDLESGRLIFARNESLLLNPASNVKLLTTAAAMAQLGPEYRFKTALYTDKDRGPDHGNLYLRGFGDPTLQVEDLWRLSAELWTRGVRKIGGDIVVDDTFFDAERIAPAFEQKPVDAAFRAPQGAVSLNYNAVGIQVQPGPSDGTPARVVVEPASPYFIVQNEARTVSSGHTSLVVESQEQPDATPGAEHTILHIRGKVRVGDAGQEFLKRVAHPDLYTGYTLKELLQRRGVKVTGKVVRGTAPQSAHLMATHYSSTLGVLARDINKRSNNFMAEQVLKTLGAEIGGKPGTWRKGLDAVAKYLEGLGILPNRYQMQNGSGLYDANRFTPAQLVTVLRAAYRDFRYAADFVGSLGLAGADGTIGHRMTGSQAERYVRAKTGTLQGISCLSGYAAAPLSAGVPVSAAGGVRGPLAFSVLMNDLADDGGASARQAQDAIAEILVMYLGGVPQGQAAELRAGVPR